MKVGKRRQPLDLVVEQEDSASAATSQPSPIVEPDVAESQTMPPGEPQQVEAPFAGQGAMRELRPPSGWPIWVAALAISVLWALAPIAFAVGYREGVAPLQDDVFALAVFALLAIGPAVFVWGAAFMIRQAQTLAFETRRAKAMADSMLSPAVVVGARASEVVRAIREEITGAGLAADEARAAVEALSTAADKSRAAAARHAETAREQVDQLSEVALSAGQKVNQVFEGRVEEARALVEQSSKMVEEAGSATARQLEEGAAAARAALEELSAILAEIEDRAGRLPALARGQAEQVRAAVADGMDELTTQGLRTFGEVQAIDAAFHDRVRCTFEMLSEAARLMGTVADKPADANPLGRPAASTPEPKSRVAVARPDQVSGSELSEQLGQRGRLRFMPTASDEEFSTALGSTGRPPARADDEEDAVAGDDEIWTWKDLLSSLDGGDGDDDTPSASAARKKSTSGGR